MHKNLIFYTKFTVEHDILKNLWYTNFQISMWDFLSERSSIDEVYCISSSFTILNYTKDS